MAVGDKAEQAGMPVVPDSGTEGKIAYGAREINRTRDFIADKSQYGTTIPPNTKGKVGDVYYRII